MENRKLITGVIYCYTNKINSKKYIGQTKNETERRRLFKCISKNYSGLKFNNARIKYGTSENWTYKVLSRKQYVNEEDASFDLDLLEMFYIDKFDSFNNGYNLTYGGDGSFGVIVSEETKKKMSDSKIGEKNSFFGKHHTDETKSLISKNRIGKTKGVNNPFWGRKHTEESKQKNREAHIGKTFSEQSRKKMSETRSIPIIQLSVDGEFIKEWKSANEAALNLHIDRSSITKCCRNKLVTVHGFKWRYKES